MQKIIYEHYEELIPENHYITDLEESGIFERLCAKHIDESQYKDITDEEAKAIIEKLNKEVEDYGKEEN